MLFEIFLVWLAIVAALFLAYLRLNNPAFLAICAVMLCALGAILYSEGLAFTQTYDITSSTVTVNYDLILNGRNNISMFFASLCSFFIGLIGLAYSIIGFFNVMQRR